jgi:peptidoglycan/LPS O-acetylase OafA/YrhL
MTSYQDVPAKGEVSDRVVPSPARGRRRLDAKVDQPPTGQSDRPRSAPLNSASRFAHIDALRAFAVLLVVVAHAGLGSIVPGGSGVTIFFAISGFIITFLLLRERDKTGGFSARSFYRRRAVKIVPPLVLIIVLPTLVYALFAPVDPVVVLAQIFFVFNWVYLAGAGGALPGSGVVWSLSIEEQFYLVFAVIWLLTVRSRHWRRIITACAAVGIVYSLAARMLLASDPEMSRRIYYGSDTRLDGIAWGVLAAIAYHLWQERGSIRNGWTRLLGSDWSFLGAIVLYAASLLIRDEIFRDTFRFSFQSVATCLVILYGLLPGQSALRSFFYSVSATRLVSLIGLASYSIYLVHLVLNNAVRDLVALPQFVEVVVLATLGIAAGILVYRTVEVPVHRWNARRTAPKNPSSPALGAPVLAP